MHFLYKGGFNKYFHISMVIRSDISLLFKVTSSCCLPNRRPRAETKNCLLEQGNLSSCFCSITLGHSDSSRSSTTTTTTTSVAEIITIAIIITTTIITFLVAADVVVVIVVVVVEQGNINYSGFSITIVLVEVIIGLVIVVVVVTVVTVVESAASVVIVVY